MDLSREKLPRPAPELLPAMNDQALAAGMNVSYVFMDNLFTHILLTRSILDKELGVKSMVKETEALKTYLAVDLLVQEWQQMPGRRLDSWSSLKTQTPYITPSTVLEFSVD